MHATLPLITAMAAAATPGGAPPAGAYATSKKTVQVSALDKSNQKMYIHWPSNATAGEKFPLVSYLHGLAGGGIDMIAYQRLFADIASYGFIVVAPSGCSYGCKDKVESPYTDCGGLPPVAPNGWSSYYGEQLKAIEYGTNQSAAGDAVFSMVDWTAGVGISGHSMGGQATSITATAECAKKWNIRAAALHHPADGKTPVGNIGVNVSIPLAAFTSSGDSIWPETHDIYYNSTVTPKVYRDQKGFSHLEPLLIVNQVGTYNPWLATMTAAWFKVYLNGEESGMWHDMIYDKSSPTSLCNYAEMAVCETVEK
eukprot:Hpha_TRINITY_DN15677_c7_g1::TRINITY_DN15677_c7_g1_i1::g.100037::m.100037